MAEMIRKLIPVEVKEVGDRILEIAGSTEDKDRMGDIIRASGWKLKNFKKNPVFMWAHNYDDPPIGRANKVWIDKETKRLMFNVEFAPPETYEFADTIYKLYKGGFLHATSVGFMPLDWEGKDEENPYPKWEDNVYTSQDLLELSAVPVPANPNALVSARDQGLITVKEFNAVRCLAEEHAVNIKLDGIASCECAKYSGNRFTGAICDVCGTEVAVDKPEVTEGEEDGNSIFTVENLEAAIRDKLEEHAEINKPEPKAISQESIMDDCAFLEFAIEKVGIAEKDMPGALSLSSEIIERSTGNDIPDNILSKVGAVLNDINKERLTQIRQLAQEVFDSADTTEEGEKQETPSEPQSDPVKQRALDVAEVANLVIAKLKGKRIPK